LGKSETVLLRITIPSPFVNLVPCFDEKQMHGNSNTYKRQKNANPNSSRDDHGNYKTRPQKNDTFDFKRFCNTCSGPVILDIGTEKTAAPQPVMGPAAACGKTSRGEQNKGCGGHNRDGRAYDPQTQENKSQR